jgi:hypothetical protein
MSTSKDTYLWWEGSITGQSGNDPTAPPLGEEV